MFINSIAIKNTVLYSFLSFLLSVDCFLYIIRFVVKNMLDASDITIKKFKDNMPGHDWENYFIKVSYLCKMELLAKIVNAFKLLIIFTKRSILDV